MDRAALFANIVSKASFLCIGLDTDPARLPSHLTKEPDPVFAFNRQIIDATYDLCVAYKPNLAFYEAQGPAGWAALEKTIDYLPDDQFIIADAKRGDIGNTAHQYALAFFEKLGVDALTIAPYMGADSVRPFLDFPNHWAIVLGLTSNPGSADFQLQEMVQGQPLYQAVIRQSTAWGHPDQLMFVVGATHPEHFSTIRQLAPEYFFLVPGVGAQGGDLEAIFRYGRNDQVGLLVNSSRGILYAGSGKDFAHKARMAAQKLQLQMAALLEQ